MRRLVIAGSDDAAGAAAALRPVADTASTLLPSCDDRAPPCWRFVAADFCAGGRSFAIERSPDACLQDATTTRVTCLGCARDDDPACASP